MRGGRLLRLVRTAAALLAAGLAACGPREQEVQIALAVPLTGDMGTEGQGIRRAVELAVEQADASGRFPFRLRTALYDDRADPEEAVNVANLIISDPRVVAVVGHYNSGCAIAAAKAYARAPMAMVGPAATNPEVTRQQLDARIWSGPRVVFRVVPTDDVQGAYAARFVRRRLGKRRILVVHDKTRYGQGLAAEFSKTFTRLGGRVFGPEGISPGTKDIPKLLARVRQQARPEGIYFGGLYTEAGLLVKKMKELGLDDVLFVSGDGAKTPGLFDVAGEAADGAYLTSVGAPVETLEGSEVFLADYRRRWEGAELRPFDHFGYEAARIILAALEKAGPDRRGLLEALRRTRHRGLLGTTSFDEKGDVLGAVVIMTRARARDRSFPPAG